MIIRVEKVNRVRSNVQALSKMLAIFTAIICIFFLSGCKDADNEEDVSRSVKAAETYYNQGQFRAAILEAKNAIKKNPKNPQGFMVLSKIYNQIGGYPATQSILEPIVTQMPQVSLELAEAYVAAKKYRSALNTLNSYEPASNDVPAKQKKQILVARSNIALGDKQAYEKSLLALKELDADKVEIGLIEAEALTAQGNVGELNSSISETLKGALENTRVLIFLGDMAIRNNEYSSAEEYYTKALGLLPKTDIFTVERLTALGQLTEVLIKQGKSGEAYRYQKILAEANPEGHAAQEKFNDAMELFRQGKFADAEKVLKELREQFPQDK
ncbi:MAG: tetratricopeptide repeat protein, partial [Sphingobacteriales bacterium]